MANGWGNTDLYYMGNSHINIGSFSAVFLFLTGILISFTFKLQLMKLKAS